MQSKQGPHKIIFVNGPPGAGKDTVAAIISRHYASVRRYKMSKPLKAAVGEFFMIPLQTWHKMTETQEVKETKQPLLQYDTPREALISLSEDWAKPRYGNDIFGKLAAQYLGQPTASPYTVISDSGFRDECLPIIKRFGGKNCLLVRMHRDGCTFVGDSRSYIELADHQVTEVDVYNNQDLEMLEMSVCAHVDKWLEGV